MESDSDNGVNNKSDDSEEEMFNNKSKRNNKRAIFNSDDEGESSDNNTQIEKKAIHKSNDSDASSDTNLKVENKQTKKAKKRIVRQLDSDSDSDNSTNSKISRSSSNKLNNTNVSQSDKSKSSSNENDSSSDDKINSSTYSQSSRIKEKKIVFESKFKTLLSKRNKLTKTEKENNEDENNEEKVKSTVSDLYDSDSDDDMTNNKSNESSDKSENEGENIPMKSFPKSKGKPNKVKVIDEKPKVQRMSAKQAMEQMHKIKSESGRMLREKQVSLPYHKPKQLSLKDILAKRKNSSITNSRFGFKMNAEQLKQYAKELEKREKEIIELCKSESEEEEEEQEVGEADKQKNNEEEKNTESREMEGNKIDNNMENKKNEFNSLQKACKNLLDLFDTNEQSANSESTLTESNNSQASTGEILDNCNKDGDETENKDLPTKITTEPFNVNVNENNKEENTEEIMKMDAEMEENSEEIDEKNCDTIDKNIDEIETCDALPESELLFEDTDMDYDFKIDEIVEKVNRKYNYNLPDEKMDVSDNSNDAKDPNKVSATQIEEKNIGSNNSQQISCSVPVLNIQPKLTGSPGCFIDLISGEVKSGVELLKKKFMFHSAIRTREEMEREKERKIHPGSALQKLKRDLEYQIIDNRTQEWTKRLEEMAQQKKEENDNLSDYEEILEKEEACKGTDEKENEEESCEEEEELEENDVDLTDKKSKKCNLLDEEAEVDDEENIVSADENEENEDENDSSEESNEDNDESGDELTTNPGVKKTLTRIIKPFDDSDSSDDETKVSSNDGAAAKDVSANTGSDLNITFEANKENGDLTTPIKENGLPKLNTSDLFESQSRNNSFSYEWDDMPLGQKIVSSGTTPTPASSKRLSDLSLTESKSSNGVRRTDLANLVSPIICLTGVPRLTLENDNTEELTSPSKYKSSLYDNDKINNLQKKLLFDSEECPTQDSQNLENLCSGKFPSQESMTSSSKPSNIDVLIDDEKNELTQDTENELLGLCTGKFVGINDTQAQNMTTLPIGDSQSIVLSLSETQDTEELNRFMKDIIQCKDTNNISDKTANVCIDRQNSEDLIEITQQNSENLNSNVVTKSKDTKISSFFKSSKTENNSNEPIAEKNDVHGKSEITGGKLAFLSSDDDEVFDENGEKPKTKVLKSKTERNKRKKYNLVFSDDESDNEGMGDIDLEEDDSMDEEDIVDENKNVDYDSEENEIEIQNERVITAKTKTKKSSEFFEQEAELTSEDEWIGSGDEDERDLDKLEWEEGDADQLDQRQVKKQLERIHLRTILDDDKREVRMLQEILLQDDLEGGTRERKFRWRNVDSTVEVGATVGDDDVDCGIEDMQTEEEWRKQRHERETFLRQMMEKENSNIEFSQDSESSLKIFTRKSSTTIITKKSLSNGDIDKTKPIDVDELQSGKNVDSLEKSKKPVKDLPSPVKKPFSLLKNNLKGSFLSRGQAALNRLAVLTKNAPQNQQEEEPTNLSSLAPGKKKNFVFAAVSPPCNKNEMPEEVKVAKRKAVSEMSTPLLIKKTKLVEQETFKYRKSLMDHITD